MISLMIQPLACAGEDGSDRPADRQILGDDLAPAPTLVALVAPAAARQRVGP